MKVIITPRGYAKYGLNQIKRMEKFGLEVDYNNTGKPYTSEYFLEISKNADGIIVGVDDIDKEFIFQCPNLKVICKFGVGIDNIDVETAEEQGIYIGRTFGTNTNAVAEHVMSFIYTDAKNIVETVEEVKKQLWNKPTGIEINGKTLGIIGFGSIGQTLAKIAVSNGMKVIVQDEYEIGKEVLEALNVEEVSFEEIICQSDYLSLHIPLTPQTVNLITSHELNMMKDTACLINTARGGIVNENDLYVALKENKIRTAYFDVFSKEPPSEDEPLLELSNFNLTPHIAARTQESEARTCEKAVDIILEKLGLTEEK